MSWTIPALAVAAVTANPGLTALAVLVLAALVVLLARAGEPPVLLFACGFQWLQASLKVLYADAIDVEVWRLPKTASLVEEASAWSMCWVLGIAVGIAFALRLRRNDRPNEAQPTETFAGLFSLYVLWSLVVFAAEPVLPESMRQVMNALTILRWAALYAVFAHAFRTRSNYLLAGGAFAVELAMGFMAFFSTFRFPLFLLALALPEGRIRLATRHLAAGAAVATMTIALAIVWTAIKNEYRQEIAAGTGWQAVMVDRDEQVSLLLDHLAAVDAEALGEATISLISRVGYVDYMALTMAFVPRNQPHEEGRLWFEAITHVLVPRVLYPDKPGIESDTRRAWRFTGLSLLRYRGTSIALGAPAETYVDFGVPWLLLPAMLFGVVVGLVYWWAMGRSGSMIDRGLAVALILPLATLENGPTKLLGGTLSALIVAMIVRPFLKSWLARGARIARGSTPALSTPPPG